MARPLSVLLALFLSGCAAHAGPSERPWTVSNPADRYGWGPVYGVGPVRGHAKPGPGGLLKATVRF